MANYRNDFADVNLETGTICRNFMNHSIGSCDALGDRFGVRVFRNGEPVSLGGTVAGYFVRNTTGETVVISSGVVSGNEAYVTLPAACYAVEGSFTLAIKVTSGSETVTMRIIDGVVSRTNTSVTVDPGTLVPSIETLISAINSAVGQIPVNYNASFAPAYSASSTYAVGDYVVYDGYLWRCTTAITETESWTAAHWTKVALASDVSDLKSAIGGIQTGEMDGFRHVSVWVNGTWSGMTLNTNNKRIRPVDWIFVKAGDVISIKNGSYVHAVCLWSGDYTTHTNIRNDGTWKNTDEDIEITADGYFIVAFADASDTSAVVYPAQFDGSITIYSYAMRLNNKMNTEIANIKSSIGEIGNSFLTGKRFEFGAYNSTYHYSEITVYGINSEIVIDADGGNLVERISNVNYPIIDKTVMVVNGSHTYRVYSDTENDPYMILCEGSWLGGYVNIDGSYSVNSTRATRFITVKDDKYDIEVNNNSLMTITVEYGSGYEVLLTEGHCYTLNKGKYAVVIMNSNKTSAVTAETIGTFSISNAVFPKVTGFPYYEEIKKIIPGAGGQGICCTNDYVFQFNGLGQVYKYDFGGNFIEQVNVSGLGHCNSATFDGTYIYVVDSGANAKIYKLNDELEIVGEAISNPSLCSLAYSDDGYFYGIKEESENSSHFASGVSLCRISHDFSEETEIKSSFLPDAKYVLQGLEVQGDLIISCLLNTSFNGIIAYFTKAGSLVKWRYAGYGKYYEFEDVAINLNGEMFTSYQGNSNEGLPLIMAKCESVTRFNASKYATNIVTGVKIGEYHDPLIIYADEDHAVLNGTITGISTSGGNLARIPANILPHVIYKYLNDSHIASIGSTAKDNPNLPLIYVVDGDGTSITYNDFYINLKNNRWNTTAL